MADPVITENALRMRLTVLEQMEANQVAQLNKTMGRIAEIRHLLEDGIESNREQDDSEKEQQEGS